MASSSLASHLRNTNHRLKTFTFSHLSSSSSSSSSSFSSSTSSDNDNKNWNFLEPTNSSYGRNQLQQKQKQKQKQHPYAEIKSLLRSKTVYVSSWLRPPMADTSGKTMKSIMNDDNANLTARKEMKKRLWTHEEGDALREVVEDLISSGSFVVNSFYKRDFLIAVEEKLKVKLPGSGLKAYPHIKSRLKHLENDFGYENRSVVSNATFKIDNCFEPSPRSPYTHGHGPRSRIEISIGASVSMEERVVGDDLVKGLPIAASASIVGKKDNADRSEKHYSRLNEELSKLGLSMMDRCRATRKIASEAQTVDIFFSIPDAEKKDWIQAFLLGKI